MTVGEIVKKYLEENRFDGLAGDNCGCFLDNLIPCENDIESCVPGKINFCYKCDSDIKENCEADVDKDSEDGRCIRSEPEPVD